MASNIDLINYQLFYLNAYLYESYGYEMRHHIREVYKDKADDIYTNTFGFSLDDLDRYNNFENFLIRDKYDLIKYPSDSDINNLLTLIKENEILKFDTIDYKKLDESLSNFGIKNNENLQEVFKDIKVSEEVKIDNQEIIEVIEQGNKTTNILLSILIGALIITTFFKNIFR